MSIAGKHVLFISYNGMLDPLGQTQVIPYLRELGKQGVRFTLLSFERDKAFTPNGRARCEELRQSLASNDIEWHRLRYHKRPSLPATCYDVLAGVFYAMRLVRRNQIEMVHARGGIPTTMALPLKRILKLKLISDVRGLVADEYAEVGHWEKQGVPYRLFKFFESRSLSASDGIVTLTEAVWEHLREWESLKGRSVSHVVVPCCADLQKFKFDEETRAARRAELNIRDKFVVVYSGSIGSWYLTDEMADFFVALREQRPDAHMLWLTQGDPQIIEKPMRERGIGDDEYTIRSLDSGEVPSYLSASDVGIAFYHPGFSKLATSPVKIAEYLACGLPIIINAGIGDSDLLVTQEHAGALTYKFDQQDYARVASQILDSLKDADGARKHARKVAEKLFDVQDIGRTRYTALYESVLN